jgi:hypothetical protein
VNVHSVNYLTAFFSILQKRILENNKGIPLSKLLQQNDTVPLVIFFEVFKLFIFNILFIKGCNTNGRLVLTPIYNAFVNCKPTNVVPVAIQYVFIKLININISRYSTNSDCTFTVETFIGALLKLIKQWSHSVIIYRLPIISLKEQNHEKEIIENINKQFQWLDYTISGICNVLKVHQSKLTVLTKKKFILFYRENKHK